MSGLSILYGVCGFFSLLLLIYLIYALFRAEEF